jgi:hypothetical protein
MAHVTMWRKEHSRCVLVVGSGQFELQIIENGRVVREQMSKSADDAITLASVWAVDYFQKKASAA